MVRDQAIDELLYTDSYVERQSSELLDVPRISGYLWEVRNRCREKILILKRSLDPSCPAPRRTLALWCSCSRLVYPPSDLSAWRHSNFQNFKHR